MTIKNNTTVVVDNSNNWVGNAMSTSNIADSAISRAKMGFSANYAIGSPSGGVTVNTGTPTTIASCQITTNGRPVMLMAMTDGNRDSGGAWHWHAIYRGETQIAINKSEWQDGGVNRPANVAVLDSPGAGTYTYSFRCWQGSGQITYSEAAESPAGGAGIIIVAVELV